MGESFPFLGTPWCYKTTRGFFGYLALFLLLLNIWAVKLHAVTKQHIGYRLLGRNNTSFDDNFDPSSQESSETGCSRLPLFLSSSSWLLLSSSFLQPSSLFWTSADSREPSFSPQRQNSNWPQHSTRGKGNRKGRGTKRLAAFDQPVLRITQTSEGGRRRAEISNRGKQQGGEGH